MKLLIKNGKVIDPTQNLEAVCDVLIDNGVVSQISPSIDVSADQIIDATDKIVAPGFVDMHTHLREPGGETKETIETGTKSAIYGGFTTVCAMPNTDPACDRPQRVQFILDKAKNAGFAHVLPIGSMTQDRSGKTPVDVKALKAAGCVALSDDGDAVSDQAVLRCVMEDAAKNDMLIIEHCEDKALVNGGVMHKGAWSEKLNLKPISDESESVIVARDIEFAEQLGVKLHIAHVSTAKSVQIIREAKKRGVSVTAEATPHHFTLTDEAVQHRDPSTKVNPPLRSHDDRMAIREGLQDDTIDVIATDHAPHQKEDKNTDFESAPFGLIGLETALSLSVMNLVDEGYLDWPRLIEKLSCDPCKILNYDRGTLKPGSIADVTIIDPQKEWVYSESDIKSLSSNSPFIDWKLKAKVCDVIVSGKHMSLST